MSEPIPEPTTEAIRVKLAELIGWMCCRVRREGWAVRNPQGQRIAHFTLNDCGVPDAAADLNAMAAVEAGLRERGLVPEYIEALMAAACTDEAYKPLDRRLSVVECQVWLTATAPAAVRALAAYRVLEDKP